MIDRKEPQIGNGTAVEVITGFFKGTEKSPERLVEDALSAFTKAQANLEVAAQAINAQMFEHEKVIRERQEKLDVATESRNRLSRIAERFADLLK
jgi:hypothetical protein